MSEIDLSTPDLGMEWCPGCEPDRDPTREILSTRWCEEHESVIGSADGSVPVMPEARFVSNEGSVYKAFADLLRRKP